MRWRLGEWLAARREDYPRLATGLRALPAVVGLCWLLVAAAAIVGFGLGAPGPEGSAPAVDFDDTPAAIVADASQRLEYRNHTVESWVRTVDFRTGGVRGGQFYRLHVEPGRGQLRGDVRPASSYSDYGFVGAGPVGAVFATEGAAWARIDGQSYWQRSDAAGALADDAREIANVSRERLVAANLTAVRDNATAFVAETTDTAAVGFDDIGTVTYVVAKGEDPYLRQIRYDYGGPTERSTRLFRVVHYGDAVAVRPPDLPPTTVSEVWSRVVRGWGRLL